MIPVNESSTIKSVRSINFHPINRKVKKNCILVENSTTCVFCKPVVMRWPERVVSPEDQCFSSTSPKNSDPLCHNCLTHLRHKCPTHLNHRCPTHLSHNFPYGEWGTAPLCLTSNRMCAQYFHIININEPAGVGAPTLDTQLLYSTPSSKTKPPYTVALTFYWITSHNEAAANYHATMIEQLNYYPHWSNSYV